MHVEGEICINMLIIACYSQMLSCIPKPSDVTKKVLVNECRESSGYIWLIHFNVSHIPKYSRQVSINASKHLSVSLIFKQIFQESSHILMKRKTSVSADHSIKFCLDFFSYSNKKCPR